MRACFGSLAVLAPLVIASCGGGATVDSTTGTPATGGAAGAQSAAGSAGAGGASGQAGAAGSAGPTTAAFPACGQTSALPPHEPKEMDCAPCPPVKGIEIDSACGPVTLASPLYVQLPGTQPTSSCNTSSALSSVSTCKQQYAAMVAGCIAEDTAPCLLMYSVTNALSGAPDVHGGTFVDGAGEMWTLDQVVFNPPTASSWQRFTASFTAKATHADGRTMSLVGKFDVCVTDGDVCPVLPALVGSRVTTSVVRQTCAARHSR